MSKENIISPIYKILLLYEGIEDINSSVTKEDYLAYLDRLYVRYVGKDEQEIAQTLRGLYLLGVEASHQTVKRAVFHMIDLAEKGAV